jgi:hypothetical protein
MNLFFFIVGAVASWGIAYYYFKRANKETPEWFSISNLKEILTKNPEDVDWTARQVVQLYNRKVFDESSSDPLQYKCCPKCGSENLDKSSLDDHAHDKSYYLISCKKCSWSDYI